jgi:gamma-glutamyltranspeptidase/glutathione hydrolase
MLAGLILLLEAPVVASGAMVVSAEPLATKAGVEILESGGNAFDAAVAVGFALAVTYPQAGNIGGGGFMVAMDSSGEFHALDFREIAPRSARRDMFLDEKGEPDPEKSQKSRLAVGVPGTVDGLVRTQYRFGKLSLREVLLPAIRCARNGFTVHPRLASSLRSSDALLRRFEATRGVFYRSAATIGAGELLKQPELSRTL